MTDALIVLGGGVFSMVLGMLWYSPALFGKAWMTLSGVSEAQCADAKAKGMGKTYVLALLNALVMSGVIYYFIQITDTFTLQDALLTGFMLWLGLVATTLFSAVLWEKKPVKLFLIKSGHCLVNIVLLSVLFVWVQELIYRV